MTSLALAIVLAALSLLVFAPGAGAEPLPVISYTVEGISGTNGWYRGSTHGNNVVLHWTVVGATSVPAGECAPAVLIPGPKAGYTETCSATNDAGTVSVTTKPIKIDAQAPTRLVANMSRKPDFNGWYNHPVSATWQGSDATSGVAYCSSSTFAGPDGSSRPFSGTCTDKAGNSASSAIFVSYDATPPTVQRRRIVSKAGANVLSWASTSPTDTVTVERRARGNKKETRVFRGTSSTFTDRKISPGVEYDYALRSTDQAGNVSKPVVLAGLPKVLTLRKLPYAPRAAERPILRWKRVHGARYYHVQLFRGSKRVLAAWPMRNELGLPAKWRWAGKRHRLTPGHYRWYVWAGVGRRALARYETIGSAKFVVPR